jgi:hypothetical protein
MNTERLNDSHGSCAEGWVPAGMVAHPIILTHNTAIKPRFALCLRKDRSQKITS